MRVATIDIGTNTILLLVADWADGTWVPVVERARIERLGRGVDRTGLLDAASIDRALLALKDYAAVIADLAVDQVGVVGHAGVARGREMPGCSSSQPSRSSASAVEVVSGLREAELTWKAVAQAFPALAAGEVVVCDVGGGSTELIVAAGGQLVSRVSLPVGSVRMAERHLAHDPPLADEVRAMIADIDKGLARIELPQGQPLIGIAGTVTTLAATSRGDGAGVEGARLSRADVDRELARYLDVPTAERARIPGLDAGRADVIPAGVAIVARVMERLGAGEVVVSDRGVRWGLALELVDGA